MFIHCVHPLVRWSLNIHLGLESQLRNPRKTNQIILLQFFLTIRSKTWLWLCCTFGFLVCDGCINDMSSLHWFNGCWWWIFVDKVCVVVCAPLSLSSWWLLVSICNSVDRLFLVWIAQFTFYCMPDKVV